MSLGRTTFYVALVVSAVACGTPARDSSPAGAAKLQASHIRDVTGDGIPDTLSLHIPSDSLTTSSIIQFVIRSNGEIFRSELDAAYDVGSAFTIPPSRDTLNNYLQDFFVTRLIVSPFDSAAVTCARTQSCHNAEGLDSVAAEELIRSAVLQIEWKEGYETTTQMAWNPVQHRFVQIYYCC